jgi:hypothetical protein
MKQINNSKEINDNIIKNNLILKGQLSILEIKNHNKNNKIKELRQEIEQ